MAASRSRLESLLARVRQRASAPRHSVPPVVIPPLTMPRFDVPGAAVPGAAVPGAAVPRVAAQKRAAVIEEEIEEYEDELIEIIDDGDVASATDSEALPLESPPLQLSASVPSVELRRRAVEPSPRPPEVARPAPVAPQALRPEAVTRKPVAAAHVVQKQGARPELRSTSFVELLDASLALGS